MTTAYCISHKTSLASCLTLHWLSPFMLQLMAMWDVLSDWFQCHLVSASLFSEKWIRSVSFIDSSLFWFHSQWTDCNVQASILVCHWLLLDISKDSLVFLMTVPFWMRLRKIPSKADIIPHILLVIYTPLHLV